MLVRAWDSRGLSSVNFIALKRWTMVSCINKPTQSELLLDVSLTRGLNNRSKVANCLIFSDEKNEAPTFIIASPQNMIKYLAGEINGTR